MRGLFQDALSEMADWLSNWFTLTTEDESQKRVCRGVVPRTVNGSQ